ncbi:MAG: glycosyltransferase [Desulfobacula sp.]|nr:glycosyltransferase [Desulfobacula sp.]
MISVIIPTFNYAGYLPSTLDSVLRQKKVDDQIEIIVVDDGSTDETAEILLGYGRRINVFRQENLGLSAARNRGLREAGGDFVLFLDSDDLLAEDTLFRQQEFLEKNQVCDVAVCRNELFSETFENGEIVTYGSWGLFAENLDVHLCHFNIAPPHAFLIRRECLQKMTFDTKLQACEDHWFWCELLAKGATFQANPFSKVYYRRHSESMSSNVLRQQRYDAILHKRIFDLLEKCPKPLILGLGLRYLACFAGILWTYQRICNQYPQESDVLKKIADESLDRAICLGIEESILADWLVIRALSVIRGTKCNATLQLFDEKMKSLLMNRIDDGDLAGRAAQLQQSLHLT